MALHRTHSYRFAPLSLTPPLWAQVVRDIALSTYLVFATIPRLFGAVDPDAVRAAEAIKSVEGSQLNQAILILTFVAALATSISLRTPAARLRKGTWTLWLFVALAGVSIGWSDYPDLASRRVLRLGLELATLSLLAANYPSLSGLFKVLFKAFAFVVILDIGMVASPASFTSIGFAGMHNHKSQAGEFAFYALPIFVTAIFNREIWANRVVPFACTIACVAVMLLSASKTSIGAMMIGCGAAIFGFLVQSKFRWHAIFLLVILAMGAVGGFLLSGASFVQLSLLMGGDSTLTGREFIWNYTATRISQAPILGYGFGSFWAVGPQVEDALKSYNITADFNQAHNGYLDIAAQLGIFGLLSLLFFLVQNTRRIVNLCNRPEYLGYYSCYIYLIIGFLLYNITESIMFRPASSFWIVWVILIQGATKLGPEAASPGRLKARPIKKTTAYRSGPM